MLQVQNEKFFAKKGECKVFPKGDSSEPGPNGTLTFTKSESKESFTLIKYCICGLAPDSFHGLHVHQAANFTDGCLSTLSHFNPYMNNHGAATDKFKHLGDLGNIKADEKGCACGENLQSDLPLCGLNSIIGRSIVVHALQDDLGQGGNDASRGPAGGNAGGRIACGEIKSV